MFFNKPIKAMITGKDDPLMNSLGYAPQKSGSFWFPDIPKSLIDALDRNNVYGNINAIGSVLENWAKTDAMEVYLMRLTKDEKKSKYILSRYGIRGTYDGMTIGPSIQYIAQTPRFLMVVGGSLVGFASLIALSAVVRLHPNLEYGDSQ